MWTFLGSQVSVDCLLISGWRRWNVRKLTALLSIQHLSNRLALMVRRKAGIGSRWNDTSALCAQELFSFERIVKTGEQVLVVGWVGK
jgi:hypothetical protein